MEHGRLVPAREHGTHRESVADTGGTEQLADGAPPQAVREADSVCDTDADGRTAESGEASGADDRTGWEPKSSLHFSEAQGWKEHRSYTLLT